MLVAFRNIYTYPNFIQCHKKLCFTVGMSNVKSVPTIFSHQMPVQKAAQKVGLSFWFFYQGLWQGLQFTSEIIRRKTSNSWLSGFFSFSFLVTLEFILIVAATIPLIVIPLFLLFGKMLKNRSLKLTARLQCGKRYDRFGQNVTTNAVKDVFSQEEEYH